MFRGRHDLSKRFNALARIQGTVYAIQVFANGAHGEENDVFGVSLVPELGERQPIDKNLDAAAGKLEFSQIVTVQRFVSAI